MKRAIIIHAWDSAPEQHWYQEEKKLLEEKGYSVDLPKMPGGLWPKQGEWLKVIEGLKPDKDTIMIGHSLGVPAILRYLEDTGSKVDKLFLIAAFAVDLGIEETSNFFEKPFDWEKIKGDTSESYVINEQNDPYVPLEKGKEVADGLGAEFSAVESNIHFDKMDLDLINSRL
ncbi:MAG: alpha/beta hydrolase [bacterium]|nr:alpha/beta hydrolase [bacterium]